MLAQTVEGYRLSFQQRRLWSIKKNNPVFCAQMAVLIEGVSEIHQIYEFLMTLASRHGNLRTTFHRLPGMKMPVQVINDSVHESGIEPKPGLFDSRKNEQKIDEIFFK